MRYISLFSGIEAASCAWHDFGWEPVAFSEIDDFPAAVLAARYPEVPNLGDITKVDFTPYRGEVDLVVGGSPCFPAGAPVKCRDGIKAIEDVKVGDWVLTHRGRYRRVLAVGNEKSRTLTLRSNTGRSIECTPEHPFLSNATKDSRIDSYMWTPAIDMLGRRWYVVAREGVDACDSPTEFVTSVNDCSHMETVYNLEVDEDNSYTVSGIAVHNCQSFSVAGKREGLRGESRLMFEYIRAVSEIMPRYFVWENVPGALSSEKGAAFGQLLREMDDLGYGLAWRVLDAQFFGVAQRRRRVFLVGSLGTERAGEILFEPESLRWDFETGARERARLTAEAGRRADLHRGEGRTCYSIAGNIINRKVENGGNGNGFSGGGESYTLNTIDRHAVVYECSDERQPIAMMNNTANASIDVGVAGSLLANELRNALVSIPETASVTLSNGDDCVGTLNARDYKGVSNQYVQEGKVLTIDANCLNPKDPQSKRVFTPESVAPTLSSGTGEGMNIQPSVLANDGDRYIVRRITPVECERLQGFPDGWTDIEFKGKDSPDSRRYKALGNSMAVPVMRWIGERIRIADAIENE